LPNQGHCNLNYSLEKDGVKYHIREFKLLDRDREFEYKIQKKVSKHGISPKPFYINKSYMVAEFVVGVHKHKLKRVEIKELSRVIKHLHSINCLKKKSTLPINVKHLIRGFKNELVLSHNDLNIKNIIFGKSVKLIDWEYTGVNDRYFDLASVILEFSFSKLDEEYFLKIYSKSINQKKLRAYKKIYHILYKEWFKKLENGKLEFLD
jgi:hypothetical protein